MLRLVGMRHLWALVFVMACADPDVDPRHRLGECDDSWVTDPAQRVPKQCEAACTAPPATIEPTRCSIVDSPRTVLGECVMTFEVEGVRGCCLSTLTYGGDSFDIRFYECDP